MEIGIESRITAPPIFIFFTPIFVPISEIAPVSNKSEKITGIVGDKSKRYMLPSRRYKNTPIPLRINPAFFFEFIFFKKPL